MGQSVSRQGDTRWLPIAGYRSFSGQLCDEGGRSVCNVQGQLETPMSVQPETASCRPAAAMTMLETAHAPEKTRIHM